MEIKNVAILGAGAIGSMIADKLEQKFGADFYLIADGWLAEPLKKDGLIVNGRPFKPAVIENREMKPERLDLVIVTVKNFHLPDTIKLMKKVIDRNTVILPLLNGVYAFNELTANFRENQVLCGIIVKTDADRDKEGNIIYTTTGEIQVGEGKAEDCDAAKSIVAFLKEAGLNSSHYENIRYMQYRKWMLNVGVNQVSALTGAEFGAFQVIPEINQLMEALMNEVREVAAAEGIPLKEEDVKELIAFTSQYPKDKKTSMLQDVLAERKTEIDYFAGDVIRYGKKHNIPTPYNHALYLAISARERVYLGKSESYLA